VACECQYAPGIEELYFELESSGSSAATIVTLKYDVLGEVRSEIAVWRPITSAAAMTICLSSDSVIDSMCNSVMCVASSSLLACFAKINTRENIANS